MNSGLNFSIKPDSLKYPYINCEAIASYSNDTVWSDVWNQYIYPRVQNDYNETYPKVNFSTGFAIGGSIGYFFSKYAGISFDFLFNKNNSVVFNKYSTYYHPLFLPQKEIFLMYSFYATMVSVVPSIILKYDHKKISPYTKIGFSMGFHEIKIKNYIYCEEKETGIHLYDTIQVEKYVGQSSTGFFSALGCNYKINENFSVFAESKIQFAKFTPDKGVVLERKGSINGGNLQSVAPLYNEVEFTDEIEYVKFDNHISYPEIRYFGNPKRPINTYSFRNWGFNIGVQYTFIKTKINKSDIE